MERKYPGLLKVSLRPEILITVLRAVRRNFVNLAAASHFFILIVLTFYICIWRWLHSGYVLVKFGTDIQFES